MHENLGRDREGDEAATKVSAIKTGAKSICICTSMRCGTVTILKGPGGFTVVPTLFYVPSS